MNRPVPTIKVLRKAKQIVATDGTWCKLVHARDDKGLSVEPTNPRAVRFCVAGAILKAGADMGLTSKDLAPLFRALNTMSGDCIGNLNDTRGRLAAIHVMSLAAREIGHTL